MHWHEVQECTECKVPPHASCSDLLHITLALSLPSTLCDPLNLPPRSLSYIHQLNLISRSQASPSDIQHRTCGTVFLLPSMFLISQLHHTALHPELVVLRSHGVFHSHLKTHLFSKCFPSHPPVSHTDWFRAILTSGVWKSLASEVLSSAAD